MNAPPHPLYVNVTQNYNKRLYENIKQIKFSYTAYTAYMNKIFNWLITSFSWIITDKRNLEVIKKVWSSENPNQEMAIILL